MSTIDAGGGPLDVDQLARLANQYFSAWPGADLQTPVPPGFGLDQYPSNFSPQNVGLPGEAELRALLEPLRSAIPAVFEADRVMHRWETSSEAARAPFDVNLIRRDFPILNERVNGRPLVDR